MLKILTLIFTALIPAVIGILGIVGTRELWDVNILEKFREVHFDSSEYRRRLSPYLVRQINVLIYGSNFANLFSGMSWSGILPAVTR